MRASSLADVTPRLAAGAPNSRYWGALSDGAVNLLISCIGCFITLFVFLVLTPKVAHWFLIPVVCCGIVVGCDAVSWARGRCDLFDPVGFVGLVGIHFFFLAPMLHILWGYTLGDERPAVDPPPDWRDCLGWMAILNFAGLLAYRAARHWVGTRAPAKPVRSVWRLNGRNLLFGASCGFAISLTAQGWIYGRYGGISGFVEAFTEKTGEANFADAAFMGMGWMFMLAECFPILSLICFAAWFGRTRIGRSWPAIILLFIAFFILRMIFGGLHGSRSNTIWALFWAGGIIHLWVRPLTKKFVCLGICFVVAFMYVYGFYKSLGSNAVEAFHADQTAEVGDETGRTFTTLMLGDLGRSDVHAFILYRLMRPESDYHYAWGRTYLGTLALFIPRSVWPGRPPTKLKEGTEVQYGVGSFDPEGWASAREYGIAGEGMLNFGPLCVPFFYFLFGLAVMRVQRFIATRDRDDARLLLCPFLVILCFWMLVADSSTMLFVIIKDGLPPLLVLWFASRRERLAATTPPAEETDTTIRLRHATQEALA